ncbi:hypothetical protein K6R49_003722 [Escherichia coli]|nr:hypothetical protein [Escherichia coli]MBJ0329690.1 hypothetical protein [Escherichia coli]
MKRFPLIALVLLSAAGSAHAARGISFPHQKHYACTWVFTGTPQQAPDLYTAVNPNSHAMTLQRPGAEPYYSKQVTDDIWEEINPEPNQDAESVRVTHGALDTYQGNMKISECVEVE